LVNKVQKEISSLSPHKYYRIYKNEEGRYWKYIPDWIKEFNNNIKINNCLDIGIAYGTLSLITKEITNCNLYGVDFIKYISNDILKKYNINYQLKNVELDSFDYDIKFELIILTEVLEHFNFNPVPTLIKIKNILTDNGVVMFSTPDSESDWDKLTQYGSWKDIPDINYEIEIQDKHIYQYSLDELKELFSIVGFKIDKTETSILRYNYKHINLQLSKI